MKILGEFKVSLFSLLLVLLAIQACDKLPGTNSEMKDDDAKASAALVGVWRGDGIYDDEVDEGWSEHWKMVRYADGTFLVEYLILHDQQKLFEQTSDSGTWKYENGEYLEVNRNGDEIKYDVFSVKKDWFEYNIAERQGTANIQESKTVEDYQLQNPPAGYTNVTYEQSQAEIKLEESLKKLESLDPETFDPESLNLEEFQ